MLTIVGMPSSEMRWLNTSSRRASVSPSEPLRSASSRRAEVDGDAVRAERDSGVADARARRHAADVGDGQQLGRRAVEACAGWPDPDGDRHRRVGDALEQRLDLVAPDDRTAAVDLQDECLCPVASERLIASSIASITIGSNRPLTCSTSTVPSSSRLVVLPGGCRIAEQRDHARRRCQQADR